MPHLLFFEEIKAKQVSKGSFDDRPHAAPWSSSRYEELMIDRLNGYFHLQNELTSDIMPSSFTRMDKETIESEGTLEWTKLVFWMESMNHKRACRNSSSLKRYAQNKFKVSFDDRQAPFNRSHDHLQHQRFDLSFTKIDKDSSNSDK